MSDDLPEKPEPKSLAKAGTHRIEEYGAWINFKKACKVCSSEHVSVIHEQAYSGTSYRKISEYLSVEHSVEISSMSISRHFNSHYIKSDNKLAPITDPEMKFKSSVDQFITSVKEKKVNFFESVSHVVTSKLEQLKKYEEIIADIDTILGVEYTDEVTGAITSGYTSTDRETTALFSRWTLLNKEINTLKNEISSILSNAQGIILKSDQETIKSHIFMTKTYLIQRLVTDLTNLLVDLQDNNTITADQAKVLGAEIVKLLQSFEGRMGVDLLYQRSLESVEAGDAPKDVN